MGRSISGRAAGVNATSPIASIPDGFHEPHGADLGAVVAQDVGRNAFRSARAGGLFDRIGNQVTKLHDYQDIAATKVAGTKLAAADSSSPGLS
jgi:hypothetical protein